MSNEDDGSVTAAQIKNRREFLRHFAAGAGKVATGSILGGGLGVAGAHAISRDATVNKYDKDELRTEALRQLEQALPQDGPRFTASEAVEKYQEITRELSAATQEMPAEDRLSLLLYLAGVGTLGGAAVGLAEAVSAPVGAQR